MSTAELLTGLPLLLLAVGSLAVLLLGAMSRSDRAASALAITVALAAALAVLAGPSDQTTITPVLGLAATPLTRTFTGLFALLAAATLGISHSYNRKREIRGEEHPATLLFGAFGMAALAAANNLLTLFLGLEAMTFAFYFLIAQDRNRAESGEAGLKYLLMGALSAAFMAFGIALLYCACGTLDNAQVMQQTLTAAAPGPIGLAGWGCVLIGLAFKLSLVPAHLWTPDVYEGAPAPVVAFLSGGSKGAALLLLLVLLPLAADPGMLRMPLWWLALGSMVVGSLAGLMQTSVRRILAYSSIAQMGYLTLALIAGPSGGYQAAAYYGLVYGVISLAAFGAVAVLEENGCTAALADYRGRAAGQPLAAAVLTLALLALAGIPPTAGFTGKFLIFAAALRAGEIPLAMTGILSAVVAAFYYLRIIIELYRAPAQPAPAAAAIPPLAAVVLLFAAAAILVLGLFPSGLLLLLSPQG